MACTPTVVLWVLAWISLSATIILVNKHILFYTAFKFPVCLATWHMAMGAATAWATIKFAGVRDAIAEHGQRDGGGTASPLKLQLLLIGALLSGVLVCGNAALLFLTVPSVQMMKAAIPATIYLVGIAMGAEAPQVLRAVQVTLVCAGVATASYGDLSMSVPGLLLQLASMLMDALRCCFLQRVLQQNKLEVSPVVTLAYVAPSALVVMLLPMALWDGPRLVASGSAWLPALPLVLLSGVLAAALNLVILNLIKLTSALTTSVTGIVKDVACIAASMHLYGTRVSRLQWLGYSASVAGLAWYHSTRGSSSSSPPRQRAPERDDDGDGKPLLPVCTK